MCEDNARSELLSALAAIELAKSSRGAPGGKANLAAAEMESGRFLAKHGHAMLGMMVLKGVGRVRATA